VKKKMLFGLLVLGLIFCLTSAPAQAQNVNHEGRWGLFAGYAYGTNNINAFDPGIHGYTAAVTYNFNNHIGLEANFSGHNGTSPISFTPATSTANGRNDTLAQDLYTYTFGPKITQRVGNFSLFTHFLVGGVHVHEGFVDKCLLSSGTDSSCFTTFRSNSRGNGFAFKTGAGVDWNHGRWDLRILEVDYIRNEIFVTETCSIDCSNGAPFSNNSAANNFELSTGISFHFGGTGY
jgi:hypothetical protein